MAREIKFRGWDGKEMHGLGTLGDIATTGNWRWIESLIPMQFTGLKDKNGKEIYEGDIIKAIFDEAIEDMPEQSTLHTVEWGIEHSYPALDLIPLKGDDERVSDEVNGFSYCLESGIDLEVIGNIYERPELLK